MNLRTAIRQLQDYLSGNTECSAVPTEWMVESTNRCNLDCPMCTRRNADYLPHDMSFFVTTHHIRRMIPRLENLQHQLGWKF